MTMQPRAFHAPPLITPVIAAGRQCDSAFDGDTGDTGDPVGGDDWPLAA